MKVNNYNFNCNSSLTELCKIGAKYGTDKSPCWGNSNLVKEYYNVEYRHSYTSFYYILFFLLRNKEINFGEIGIAHNASIKMWREYFLNAKIYAWDGSEELIKRAEKDNLINVQYDYMHTQYEESIKESFLKCNVKFDILIDDASHLFWDQIRLIRLCVEYMKSTSILIIEDIDKNILNNDYVSEIKKYGHDKYFESISFIEFHHNNSKLGQYDNDKIILITFR